MVYDSYEFGKYLTELRRKYNVSMNVVCDGICDQSVMSRIENGEREVSKLVQDRLLGRLGVAPENFENMVFSDEYERWKVRQKIVNLIMNEKIDSAEELLEKMYSENTLCERRKMIEDLDAVLEMQFYYAMKAQIQQYKNVDGKQIRGIYKQALKQTVNGFEKSMGLNDFFKNRRFSVEELNLLIEYVRYLPVSKGITSIRNIVKYIETSNLDKLAKANVYPKAVYFLYMLESKRGIENNKKIMKLLEAITEAIEYLRNSLRIFYLYELLDAKMKLISMCDESLAEKYNFHIADLKNKDMVDVNYMDRYGNTGQYSFEEQYIWCKFASLVLDDIYARSKVRKDTFEYCYIYVDRDVYCIEDVIRIRRKMLKMSMGNLCRDICSERTISRLERKLMKPQAAQIHKLFERLGLSCEFSRTELTTSDINAQEILRQIRMCMNNGNSDKADELLSRFSERVDCTIAQNKQIMLRVKACSMRMGKKISDMKFVEYIKDALECTLPYKVAVADGEKYMSNGEISCINNILVTKSSEIKEVEECYNALLKLYQNDDMIMNFLSMYEFVMQPVASYCGDCGRYDKADEIEKTLLINTMMNRRLTIAPMVIYCLLWNNLQRKNKNLSLNGKVDKDLELRKCLILNDIAKNNRKYKIIGNIIQKE